MDAKRCTGAGKSGDEYGSACFCQCSLSSSLRSVARLYLQLVCLRYRTFLMTLDRWNSIGWMRTRIRNSLVVHPYLPRRIVCSYLRAGRVYLFGKTALKSEPNRFVSCCITVENIDRNVYVVPRSHVLAGQCLRGATLDA